MATLTDIIKELQENNQAQKETSESIQALNNQFNKYFKALRNQEGDREEARRERQKSVPGGFLGEKLKEGQQAGADMSLPFIFAMNPLKLIAPLTAGLSAFALAMEGMRGWEILAIEKISSGINSLIRNVLKGFGIDELTGELDANGRRRLNGSFHRGALKSTSDMIIEAMSKLKTNVLNGFGLLDDGRIPALDKLKALFATADDATPGTLLGKVGSAIGRIINIPISVFKGVTLWTAGAGAKLLGFLDSVLGISKATGTLVGGAGKFLGFVGKILWPLGFLMSAWEGITAYQESDADGLIAKLGAGIGGFLGSFIGAPFDLLKKGVEWITVNWLGVDENSKFMTMLKKFSFQETISDITKGIFGMVEGAVKWIKTLFVDPKAALTTLWSNLTGGLITAGGLLTNWIEGAVGWIKDLFPDPRAALTTLWSNLTGGLSTAGEILTNWITSFYSWLGGFLPDVSAMANSVTNAIWEKLPDWLKNTLSDNGKPPVYQTEEQFQASLQVSRGQVEAAGDNMIIKGFNAGPTGALEVQGRSYGELYGFKRPAPAPVVINNIDQSTASGPVTISKGGDTYRSSTPAPYAVDNHYSRQYMGIPGRGMYGY